MPNGEVKAVNAIQVVATINKSIDLAPRFFKEESEKNELGVKTQRVSYKFLEIRLLIYKISQRRPGESKKRL
jgi:hypothetical protein